MVNLDDVPFALTIGNAAANLDLEEERTDGKTAATPQLIRDWDAILVQKIVHRENWVEINWEWERKNVRMMKRVAGECKYMQEE